MLEWWIFSESFLITIFVYTVVSISLNLEAGFTGIPNFGKHFFVFLGAFAAQGIGVRIAAWLYEKLEPQAAQEALQQVSMMVPSVSPNASLVSIAANPDANRIIVNNYLKPFVTSNLGVEVLLAIVILGVTVALALIFGLVASYAALRLREDYLAILLLSFAELMVMVVFYQSESLNGGNKGLWAITFTRNPMRFALIGSAALAILAYIYAEKIANSPMGRAMRAVRDDEVAASVFGRDIASIRLRVIMVASVMAALAGLFYIQNNASATSITFNRVAWTFLPWAMIILGGMANNAGAVIGTLVFLIGMRLFTYYQDQISHLLGIQASLVASLLPNILIGILILVVLYLRPQGIIPEHISKTLDFKKIMREEAGLEETIGNNGDRKKEA
ncbi:branched-chain amino acid ABC transporter permease [Pyrofollis japonicus]|uniref:branched-chain amino acid ABC transporter permease n=1 Tax=Pyrofollis japonicus TaxID=3060460 RepID=UPI00295B7FD5|nr:branched-chain amino acid ABC transporter permease [Pyrofollis japonicus]BEP17785.1 branched-chain amino acid ABC transporter permease [Pyrofollis japonicus]